MGAARGDVWLTTNGHESLNLSMRNGVWPWYEGRLQFGRDAALQRQSGSDRPRTAQRAVPTTVER